MAKTICVYHGNCADGFTAAWVVMQRYLSKAQADKEMNLPEEEVPVFYAGVYQKPVDLEVFKNNHVIIVDFSYSRAKMQEICEVAQSVIWIDHHKSAMLDMEGFKWNNFEAYTDLTRSGAGLAWDYFMGPHDERPALVNIVEDRDLWKFKLPDTRVLQAYIFSFKYSFETWDALCDEMENSDARALAASAGESIERKHFKDIDELLPICTRHIRIAGHIVPCANLPYTMVSDAGHILAERNPSLFGVYYYDGMSGRNFSLRSVEGGMDVSVIAKQFGGGGHERAAGFRVSLVDAAALFDVLEFPGGSY